MSLRERYEILETIADGEARTFRARDRQSSGTVWVHLIRRDNSPPGARPLPDLVIEHLRENKPQHPCQILDLGEEGGVLYAITNPLVAFESLRASLALPAVESVLYSSKKDVGEFTKRLLEGVGGTAASAVAPSAVASPQNTAQMEVWQRMQGFLDPTIRPASAANPLFPPPGDAVRPGRRAPIAPVPIPEAADSERTSFVMQTPLFTAAPPAASTPTPASAPDSSRKIIALLLTLLILSLAANVWLLFLR